MKKVFLSDDIEGVNGISCWDETEYGDSRYPLFQQELQKEVNAFCEGAHKAGAEHILIKDAHDSARNLDINDLPEYTELLRGWDGGLCCMMAGLDSSFDCACFVGYHSPSRSGGNSLSHTMNSTRIFEVRLNDEIVSEFMINAMYATYLGVPCAFISGDSEICRLAKEAVPNIITVASKEGYHCAVKSKHPKVTQKEILEGAKKAISNVDKNDPKSYYPLPKHFKVQITFKDHNNAYRASFFPGCKLTMPDQITFESDNYYDCLVVFKFLL